MPNSVTMEEVTVPQELIDRYERLAEDLDGFAGAEALVEYVLRESVDELERTVVGVETEENDLDEEGVEDRLRELGYLG